MAVRITSVAFQGVEAVPVEVEIQKTRGLFGQIAMVGLPSNSVRESRDRVRAAVQACSYPFPKSSLIINFAPADLKKEGSFYDLPVALGILAATNIIPPRAVKDYLFLGELALDGRLRPVPGTLSAAILARESGKRGLVVPPANSHEAGLVPGIEVLTAPTLRKAALLFGAEPNGDDDQSTNDGEEESAPSRPPEEGTDQSRLDFTDVVGQESAKEAMTIVAAGGHNILMLGPPGSGKTMMARRLPSLMSDLDTKASIEVSRIYSFTRQGLKRLVKRPPFRAPHHTISYAAIVGGGNVPHPGEVSLSHRGILFLDELPEFERRALEALRQPLEEEMITISRASGSVTLPARITLIASMNPCPCGFYGDARRPCICTPKEVGRYLNRISGPILDRLDMHIEVPAVSYEMLKAGTTGDSSSKMSSLVAAARERQKTRWASSSLTLNAHMSPAQIRKACPLTSRASRFLEEYMKKHPLSARGYSRILRIARTVADIEGSNRLHGRHIERTVMFRFLDRVGE